MKTIPVVKNGFVLLAVLTIFYACSKNDASPKINPEASGINSFIQQFPDWNADSVPQKSPVFKSDVMVPGEVGQYQCQVFEKNLVKTLSENIISVETNFGTIWPGALIQGNTLKTGELKTINVNRSPETIQINIPLTESSKLVDVPNSVNVQQAISDFQIAAGQMPEGSQAGAGLMNFSVQEAASFEQSMLSMGISGGFTDPESQVGLDASTNVSQDRSYREHTVIAKFVQKMFTVRVADDQLTEPADFFAQDVTLDDIKALENKGELGADNIPLYIESVTYGRILLFSMTSTDVSSGEELSSTLRASMSNYASAGASLTDKQKQTLENSTTTIFSAGGTKDAANAAIANLNWGEFFKAAPASTAVPISFVAKTLNGEKIVKLVGNVDYLQRDNCQAPSSYDVTVTWTNNDFTGICNNITCPQQVWVKKVSVTSPTLLTPANQYIAQMHFTSDEVQTLTGRQFTIKSYVEITGLGLVFTKTQTDTYDISQLINGNNTVSQTISNAEGSVTLDFNIRRIANY